MERRWAGPDGYEIVPAVRAGRQVLRVRRHGWLIADCLSAEDVGRYVDLAELCEVVVIHRATEVPRAAAKS
jgi:hypothetical protein